MPPKAAVVYSPGWGYRKPLKNRKSLLAELQEISDKTGRRNVAWLCASEDFGEKPIP
jgi:hypothetical protein